MKKLSVFLLITALILSLFACNEKYEPVKSTDEEARVIMTFEADGEKYEVRYELYRALFLANRDSVDGGDGSVWTGENRTQYIDAINKIILAKSYKIYAAIHHAAKLGFDAYSNDVDTKIDEYVKGAVEGDDVQQGHGSYEAYLASLKENYLNYSVSVLLLRYSLAMDAINEYYGGYEHEVFGHVDGEFEISRDDVKSYYYADTTARFIQVYIPEGIRSRSWVEELRTQLIEKDSVYDMAVHIITNTTATESDLIKDGEISGLVIGKNSLDDDLYSEYTQTLFSLSTGEMSEIITLKNTDADGYYLIYVLEKSDEHFDRCYDTVKDSYIDDTIGSRLAEICNKFAESTEPSDAYSTVEHGSISMD